MPTDQQPPAARAKEPPVHVQIVLFDGFDPLDVIAPYEVLYADGAASGGAVVERRAVPAGGEHRA